MQQIPLSLAEGEIHVGTLSNQAGQLYHLILLAGDNDRAPQQNQLEWAASIGGDLPNKVEAMMLFSYAKDQFQEEAYWTNETFLDSSSPEDDEWAWGQDFSYGTQNDYR